MHLHSAPSDPPYPPVPPRSRLGNWRIYALAAGAIVVIGLIGLRAMGPSQARPVTDDGRLRIEVVHPVEPAIVPGAVMEVGQLVDAFQGLPPPRPDPSPLEWFEDAWLDVVGPPPPPAPTPSWRTVAATARVPVETAPPPRRDEGRWFGFDAPRRDFRAERAARRARMEALDRRMHEALEARDAARRYETAWPADKGPQAPPRSDGSRWGPDQAQVEAAADAAIAAYETFTAPE